MSKKLLFIVFAFVLFFSFHRVFAGLVVTEIMYYPPEGQHSGDWFEVYNNGNTDVIVESDKEQHSNPWKFFKLGLSTKYYINNLDFTIKPGEYVVFSDDASTFSSDYATSVKIIDSTISLSNSNKTTLQILDENLVSVVSAEYDPSKNLALGDGNSLQLINGSWIAALPTPGTPNENNPPSSSGGTTNTTTTGGGTSTQGVNETVTKITELPKIKTKILASTLAYAGIPFDFSASSTGYSGEQLNYGKYYWNFGDGDSKEVNLNKNEKFTHIYYYPGEYEVSLEYYFNFYSQTPETISKFIVKVISATVSISKIGDDKDFFVELSNNSDYDINLSKWQIVSLNKNFIFPKNTNISTKGKLILSPKITGFTLEDKDSLRLLTSNGEVAFEYNVVPKVIKTVSFSSHQKIISQNKIPNALENETLETNPANQNLSEDLVASALLANGEDEKNTNNSYIFFWGFVVFLIISGSAVYYIRQNKGAKESGDDFDIIDE